jgi:hypothetical protein
VAAVAVAAVAADRRERCEPAWNDVAAEVAVVIAVIAVTVSAGIAVVVPKVNDVIAAVPDASGACRWSGANQ